MVAFDTNVFMGSAKDRNIIMECLRRWRTYDPQIHILLPRVRAYQVLIYIQLYSAQAASLIVRLLTFDVCCQTC